jgi:rubrerythrin
MNLKGSETAKNLLKAFAGESQARNRYTYFASVARKEGYEQISAIFLETADNEKEHAKVFFQHLQNLKGEGLEIDAKYPAGKIGTTRDNLLAAANGEHKEWTSIYANFEKIARKEGFKEIADSFKQIAEVEEKHEKRYTKLLKNILNDKVFKKDKVVMWKCRNCGYIHVGKEAPKKCPACKHPQAFYEIFEETY